MSLYVTTTSLATVLVGVDFDTLTTNLASITCEDAQAEVNKYLSRRYDISSAYFQTTTSIPPLVRTLSLRLAEGYMWQRQSRGAKESLKRGNDLEKSVLENLKAISEYKMDLTDTLGSAIVDATNPSYRVKSTSSGYEPTFNEDDPKNWRMDPDKTDDIADERDN